MKTGASSVQWEKVHVFISSTFNDMHAERDYLVKRVFPELQDWCERRKLRLVDIDLRWGVSEQDATQNRNVVKVCLSRIDDCRPFFLCFLGQRRGWVPRAADVSDETFATFPELRLVVGAASVTEMEILHALIKPFHQGLARTSKRPAEYYEPAKHAFFFLRDPSYLSQLPSEPLMLRETFTNEAVSDPVERAADDQALRRWREHEIPAAHRPVHSYHATWDPTATTPELSLPLQCPSADPENQRRWRRQWEQAGVNATDLDLTGDTLRAKKAAEFNRRLTAGRLAQFRCGETELSDTIIAELQAAIAERYPDHVEVAGENALQQEIDQQEQFLFTASEGFIARAGDFDELDAYVSGDSRQLFALTAEGGMGKSTVLANWFDRFRGRKERTVSESVHFRFIGQSDGTTTIYALIRSLLTEIKYVAGKFDDEIPLDPVKLRNEWPRLLASIGQRGKTVIVFDGLNQLESGLSDVSWLPQQLPANIKLIVSFKRGDEAAEQLHAQWSDGGRVRWAEVKAFTQAADRGQLVTAYLDQYLKELDGSQVEVLINLRGAENPLYLKVILSELRVFGAFANLSAQIRSNYGDTPVSAFVRVLERLEHDPSYSPIEPTRAVPMLFGLLAHARKGLSVDELTSLFIQSLELTDDGSVRVAAADTVNLFLRQVRPFLSGREGRYDFFFESFKLAALECYVTNSPTSNANRKRSFQEWHGLLAGYFAGLPTWQHLSDARKSETERQPTLRKVAELPFHLIKAEQWNGVEQALCDLEFIEAKCTAGGTYELVGEFELALNGLPDHPKNTLFETKDELTGQWLSGSVEAVLAGNSEALSGEGSGPTLTAITGMPPTQPYLALHSPEFANGVSIPSEYFGAGNEIVTAIEDIQSSRFSIPEGDTSSESGKYGQLESFQRFISTNAHIIERYPSDVVGLAYNLSIAGPVTRAAEEIFETRGPLILRRNRPTHNFRTPLLRTIEVDAEIEMPFAITRDGRRAIYGGSMGSIGVVNLSTGAIEVSLDGHGPHSTVTDIAIAADGNTAVSASTTGLTMWDLRAMNPTRQWDSEIVNCVSITADGGMVVSGHSDDNLLGIWNARSGHRERILRGHDDSVEAVAITPDGKLAVSGSRDHTVRVWDLAKGDCLRILRGHHESGRQVSGVFGVAVSDDGRLAVSGGEDGTVRVWDTIEGKCLRVIESPDPDKAWVYIRSVSVTPKGRLLAIDCGSMSLWDVRTGVMLRSFGTKVLRVEMAANGRLAVSGSGSWGSNDKTLQVWELAGHYDPHPEGEYIEIARVVDNERYVVGTKNEIQVWSNLTGDCERVLEVPSGRVSALEVFGEHKAVSGGHENTVRIWNYSTGNCERTIEGHTNRVMALAVTPDNQLAISGGWDGTLRCWNITSGRCLWRSAAGSTSEIKLSPDGCLVFAVGNDRESESLDTYVDTLRAWNVRNGKRLWALRRTIDEPVNTFQQTPDGRVLMVGTRNGLYLLDSRDSAIIVRLADHPERPLAITPDGRRGITGSSYGLIHIWDLASHECLWTASGQTGNKEFSTQCVVRADGRLALSDGPRSSLVLWDLESGRRLANYDTGGEIYPMIGKLALDTFSCALGREAHFLRAANAPEVGFPVVTATRLWLHLGKVPFHWIRGAGRWDKFITTICPWCGARFLLPQIVQDAIEGIAREVNLPTSQISCLSLPLRAWNEPRLQSSCTNCDKRLKFNPFIVDNRSRY